MNPLEALDLAIVNGLASDRSKPGKVVSLMSVECRAALARLTSDQALQMRPVWLLASPRRRGRFNAVLG